MKNKQTAVKVFAIKTLMLQLQLMDKNMTPEMYELEYFKLLKEAKQMEKEQHSETWKRGSYSLLEHGSGEDFEQYYNETYGK